ncbi:MAG: hypothetical protein JW860_01615 [Sedimentisphaerales bacterium]|nr:hypothetical protein [Sedimentisphaerales bacterium]
MKLPKIDNVERYAGLYVIDFGDQCGIGYTAEEVALLVESEQFADVKLFKIHRALPDGTMELAGVIRDKFFQESGMFFHCLDEAGAHADFERLADWGTQEYPPCRVKMHLAEGGADELVLALLYPAEYEQEIGQWLRASGFRGHGPVDAGTGYVNRYYEQGYEVRRRHQFWPAQSLATRSREELLDAVGMTFQR